MAVTVSERELEESGRGPGARNLRVLTAPIERFRPVVTAID